MSAAPRNPVARVARAVAAPLISGSVAAIIFLVMIQGAFRRGHTTLDFNHVLGTMVAGEATEVGRADEALGVVGDSVGPTGLWATIVGGIALMAIHELVIVPLVRRHWLAQAVPLALLTMLAVGVVFASAADARFDTPIGLFASDAGERGVLVVVLCSIGFAVVGARAHDLARRAWWWEPRPDPLAGADLEDVAGFGSGPRRPTD